MIPDTIRILGLTYDVVENPDLMHGHGHSGTCWRMKQVIEVDPAAAPTQQAATLWHEALETAIYAICTENVPWWSA